MRQFQVAMIGPIFVLIGAFFWLGVWALWYVLPLLFIGGLYNTFFLIFANTKSRWLSNRFLAEDRGDGYPAFLRIVLSANFLPILLLQFAVIKYIIQDDRWPTSEAYVALLAFYFTNFCAGTFWGCSHIFKIKRK